ncbi:unnamed protein product, partial [Timema podura]|nr:unnamed protein product [Timema podura]
MDPSIGTIESGSTGRSLPNSFGDESSLGKQCIDTQYDSLADLISSHLEINKPSDSLISPDMTRDGNCLAGIGHSLSEMRVDDKNIKLVIPSFGRSSLLRRERNPFSRDEDSSPDTTGNAVKGVASPVEAPNMIAHDGSKAFSAA